MSAGPLEVSLAAPLLGAAILALLPLDAAKNGLRALLALAASLVSLFAIGTLERGDGFELPLIPSLGITLHYEADRLSLFFGSLVTAVGALVLFYARGYFEEERRSLRGFYVAMLSFMGAMLATVFAVDLLTMFIAWEITGICSFFLIGWDQDAAESRRGARMALLTTVGAGLGLFFSIFALESLFGTLSFSELTERVSTAPLEVPSSALFTGAFFAAFLAIAGKSALIPFHYWLPNAMAAPTPVSAYLHSATMVKLGVFLMARLTPIFGSLDVFMPTLATIGFGTLLVGTLLALFASDLKQIFAQTTVAQLGLLVGVYGLGGGTLDLLHILNHSLYKASLFMVAGIVDHAAHTRDIRQLGGVMKRAPLLAFIAAVALASFAGLPLTTGFLSKELLFELGFEASFTGAGVLFLTAVLNVFIALRVFVRVFLGEPRTQEMEFTRPSLAVQLPPLFLVTTTLALGSAPPLFRSLLGRFDPDFPELALYHGLGAPLIASILAFAVGAGLAYMLRKGAIPRLHPSFDFARHFDRFIDGLPKAGGAFSEKLGFRSLSAPLLIVFGAIALSLGCVSLIHAQELAGILQGLEPFPAVAEGYLRYPVAGLIAIAAALSAMLPRTIAKLIALSLAGFGIAVYYLLYRAPDLALTQLLVETATLLLILLVLRRMRGGQIRGPERSPHIRALISIAIGASLCLFVLLFQQNSHQETLGDYFLAHSLELTEGRNAVNTVVVDFRGFDTLLEIAVLFIATLASLGLLHQSTKKTPSLPPFRELSPLSRDLILQKIALYGILPLQLFSLHLFFRGHNAPGGGFVAGLVTALSILLVGFAFGPEKPSRYLRLAPRSIASIGLAIALFVAVLPAFLSRLFPAFESASILHHIHPKLGELYLGSPLFFDLGVFLTVVGVIPALVFPLLRSVQQMMPFSPEELPALAPPQSEPIDVIRSHRDEPAMSDEAPRPKAAHRAAEVSK